MRKSRPRKTRKNLLQNPAVVGAIITGVVGVLIALIQVVTPLLNRPEPERTEPPTLTAFVSATPPPTVLPTLENTVAPTTTVPVTLSDTPTPSPLPPSVTCLNGWWTVNTLKLATNQESREGCDASNIPELGFSTSADGFLVTLQSERFKEIGIFGISSKARLPDNAVIRLRVDAYELYNAEFWIGLSNSPDFNPDTMILSLDPALGNQQFQSGNIRIYRNNFNSEVSSYLWPRLNTQARKTPPFYYNIELIITGGNVNIRVNDVPLSSQVVNIPRHLFIGFRNKTINGSVDLIVKVSVLEIEARP